MSELLLGQIPEAIYFSLFLIFTKELKTKRILFVIIMILEYVLLLNLLSYSMYARILYFILTYIIMKILYKEKSNITDIFTLGIASVWLIPLSLISFAISGGNIITAAIISIFINFILLYILRNTLPNLTKIYNKYWNRNDKLPKKMKSTTFRALNLVLFNLSFVILNIAIVVASICK